MSKIYKSIVNENPKLTPILFAIYTGTHKGVKSVITFFRVDSLFTNMRLDENIDINVIDLFKTQNKQKILMAVSLTMK